MRIVRIYNRVMFLDVSQLTVRYPGRERPAVDGVSLGLRAGDIGALIGPSGCGKTTLLRAVAGLEAVHAGHVHVPRPPTPAGVSAAATQSVGMVFQDYALFPHLDVRRNVAFGLHGWPAAQCQARVDELLALVALEQVGLHYPHQLSGGQQQRVALARALAPQPALLLLDEPFSSLDVDLRERLAHELRSILKAAKATALFVTHDQQEAFAMGDVIGVMHQGHLQQWADAYTLYHRPATRFVAEFIGHGVFAPAHITQDGSVVRVHTPLGDLIDAQGDIRVSDFANGLCDVLLRADDIVHDDQAPLQAEILRKSFRGSEFLYTLRLAGGLTVMAHVGSHHNHAVGEWIGIRPEVDHVVVFSRAL